MAPNSPACSFIQASMAGSLSTAPLNRSSSVLIVAPLSAFEIGRLRNTLTFLQSRPGAADITLPSSGGGKRGCTHAENLKPSEVLVKGSDMAEGAASLSLIISAGDVIQHCVIESCRQPGKPAHRSEPWQRLLALMK